MNWYQRIAHFFPLFHVSDDDQFGDIGETTEKDNLRYSLLTLWFGKYIIHILSIKNGKPSLIKVLDLDVILDNAYRVNEESIKKYNEALNDFENDTIRDHLEALRMKIDEEQSRVSTTLEKNSVYNAVLLVFITIAVPYLIHIYKIRSIANIIMILMIMIFYFSAFSFSFRIIKVSGRMSFTFNEIAKSQNSLHSFASALYYRYKHAKSEADKIVSYGINQQKNVYQLFASVVILLVLINVYGAVHSKTTPDGKVIGFYQFSNDDNKINTLQALNKIEKSLITGQSIRIIITGGEEKQVEKVHNILDFYNVKDVPINIIKSKSDTEMSLIIVKGEK